MYLCTSVCTARKTEPLMQQRSKRCENLYTVTWLLVPGALVEREG